VHSPTLTGKILLLFILCVSFYYFRESYFILFLIFSALSAAVFVILRKISPGHSLSASGILFVFPLLLLAADFRIRMTETIPEIPDPYFVRKEKNRLKALSGRIQLEEMLSPGVYRSSFYLEKQEEGFFPKRKKTAYRPYFRKSKKYKSKKKYKNSVKYQKKKFTYKSKKSSRRNRLSGLKWRTTHEIQKKYSVILFSKSPKLYEGCVISARLYGKTSISRIKENSYGDYLRKKGGRAAVYLKNQNSYKIDCREIYLRGKFKKFLNDTLTRHHAKQRVRGMILGIMLGKSGYMDREFKKNVLELGILHLFAASGLHLGILYLCFYIPLSFLFGKKHPVSLLLPLPVCFMYLFLLAFPISLLRAFSFLFFNGIKSIVHRRLSTGNYIVNTALVLFFISPEDMTALSGILSFSAVAGILLFQSKILELFAWLKGPFFKWLHVQISLTLSASLIVAPVLIYVFRAHSFISILFNLAAVPTVSVILPLAFFATAAEWVPAFSMISETVFSAVFFLMECLIGLIDRFSAFGLFVRFGSWKVIPFFSSIWMILLLIVYSVLPEQKRIRYRHFFFAALIPAILIIGPPGYFLFYGD